MENEVKLKIEEWELLVQVKILDPDGFDRTNPNLFNEKFTYKEFKKAMYLSTQKSMTHEEWTSQYERLHNSNKHEPPVMPNEVLAGGSKAITFLDYINDLADNWDNKYRQATWINADINLLVWKVINSIKDEFKKRFS